MHRKYRQCPLVKPRHRDRAGTKDVRGWLIPVRVIQRLIAESPAYQKTVFRLFTLRYSSLTTLT